MVARLAVNVVLRGPDGEPRPLYAGDEVPNWAADRIGAHCLAKGPAQAGPKAAEPKSEAEDTPPPKAGRGSSTDAWANYAERNGVQVELDAKREDIIAALEQAGVPTE